MISTTINPPSRYRPEFGDTSHIIVRIALYIELFSTILGSLILFVAIYICYITKSFHVYFRVVLLFMLTVLLSFEVFDIFNPLCAIFPQFAEDFNLHIVRWWGQTLSFEMISLVFLLICIERTVAVSYISHYEEIKSARPMAIIIFIIVLFIIISKLFFSLVYEFRTRVLWTCLFMDIITIMILIGLFVKNRSLKNNYNRTLTSKYQLVENIKVTRIILPIVVFGVVTKGIVLICIWGNTLHITNIDRTVFLTIYRIIISIYSIYTVVHLFRAHQPYYRSFRSLLSIWTCSIIQPFYDDQTALDTRYDHDVHFHLLQRQWNIPRSEIP